MYCYTSSSVAYGVVCCNFSKSVSQGEIEAAILYWGRIFPEVSFKFSFAACDWKCRQLGERLSLQ